MHGFVVASRSSAIVRRLATALALSLAARYGGGGLGDASNAKHMHAVALITSPKCAYYSISRWYSRNSGGDLPPPLYSLRHPP